VGGVKPAEEMVDDTKTIQRCIYCAGRCRGLHCDLLDENRSNSMKPELRPYYGMEHCTDLAFDAIKSSGAKVNDENVEDLAEAIKAAIDSWFGDCKHLTPSYRPDW
jgi:hypothetical protein